MQSLLTYLERHRIVIYIVRTRVAVGVRVGGG